MIANYIFAFVMGLLVGISISGGIYFLLYEIKWAKEVEAFHIAGERLRK